MANDIINSLKFGSDTHVFTLPYGTCNTAAGTVVKTVDVDNFALQTGARVLVKFTVTNTVASPQLNVESTGAKLIYYKGSTIPTSYLAANRTYEFVYNGTQWDLIGDVNTDIDTKVTQSITTSNAAYPLLLAPSGQTATTITTSYFDSGVTLNPSNNTIAANISGNAASASYASYIPTSIAFTPADTAITPDNVYSLIGAGGRIKRGTWSYGGNGYIATGSTTASQCPFGVIDLAGTTVIQAANGASQYTQIYITPSTAATTGAITGEMIYYINNGSDYKPTWYRVLTNANYNIYAPTKTGGGASGTWGINITGSSASCTGNAATASSVAWSGVTSKPSYYDAKAIKSITRSGTTFTYTCMDNTTGTFTQQDNNTDTKNTAGSTNTTSKIYLIGATSQAANPTTYSNSSVYATNGVLTATSFSGSGASLTSLNASNISSGTLNADRLPTVPISKGGTGATTATNALINLHIRYDWQATITGATWSRLCYVPYGVANIGSKYILYVGGTRSNVVYSDAYLITVHSPSKGKIIKIAGSSYSAGYQIRVLASNQGNSYVELYDNLNSFTNSSTQSVTCRLIPIYCGSVTRYTSFTTGTTLPSGFSVAHSLTTDLTDIQAWGIASTYSKVTDYTPSSGTWYYPTWVGGGDDGSATGTNWTIRVNDGFRYYSLNGTTSARGEAVIQVGNSIATGTAGNKIGRLRLFAENSYYTEIYSYGTPTSNYVLYLPNGSGTLARTADNVASSTKLQYLSLASSNTTSSGYYNPYTWTITGTYTGVAGIYGIMDSEQTNYAGIFSVKCRNSSPATTLSTASVKWLQCNNAAALELFLTTESLSNGIKCRLYVTCPSTYRSFRIFKLSEQQGSNITVATSTSLVTSYYGTTQSVARGGSINANVIWAPTTSGGSSYSAGTNGYVLKSNGSSVFWSQSVRWGTSAPSGSASRGDIYIQT